MKKLLHFSIGSAIRRALGLEKKSLGEHRATLTDEGAQPAIIAAVHDDAPGEVGAPVNGANRDEPQSLLVWMIERDRYGVRGRALCTKIEVYQTDAVDLCEEIQGYVLNAPNGETVVVEGRTGGLVGHSLETVLDGIRDMSYSDLARQLDSAKKEFDRMSQEELAPAMFWVALKMGDEDTSSTIGYE